MDNQLITYPHKEYYLANWKERTVDRDTTTDKSQKTMLKEARSPPQKSMYHMIPFMQANLLWQKSYQ